jgi:WD40 repeat protein
VDAINDDPKATCLAYQEKVAVNMSNTCIATVTTDYSLRLQQLWKEGTGELLWKCEQKYDPRWKVYPSFSPDGQYVGFHDGAFSLLLLDTSKVIEVVRIDCRFLDRPVQSFAIGPWGQCLAIAATQSHKFGRVLSKYFANDRSIDIVPVAGNESSPELRYTADGKILFFTSLLWTFYHGWNLGRRRWKKALTRRVNTFNVLTGHRERRSASFRKVVDYDSVCGLLRIGQDTCLVLDVTNNKPGDRRFGFLWRVEGRKEAHKILVVSSTGKVISKFLLVPGRQMIVSNGSITFVDTDGEVRTWDGINVVTEPLAWSMGRQPIEGRVVAFSKGRLTLLAKGEFTFVATVVS